MSSIEKRTRRLTTVIAGRNLQRVLGESSSFAREGSEKKLIAELLGWERERFASMGACVSASGRHKG